MTIVRFFLAFFILANITSSCALWNGSNTNDSRSNAYHDYPLTSTASRAKTYDDYPITTDNRIKTYIYSPNEVYLLVLHYGFQSHIEFAKNEEVQNINLGDSYAWKISVSGNRLFIKPMEKNIRTNMTIITNKKTYQFDIVAKELEDGEEKDLVYVVRFISHKKRNKL